MQGKPDMLPSKKTTMSFKIYFKMLRESTILNNYVTFYSDKAW